MPQHETQRTPSDVPQQRTEGYELHHELRALGFSSTKALGMEELRSRLTSMQSLLKAEEQDCMLADVARRDPRFQHESDRLIQERKELANALQTLLELTAAADSLDEGLWLKVRHWTVRALKHEEDEDLLLMNAVNQDLGAAD